MEPRVMCRADLNVNDCEDGDTEEGQAKNFQHDEHANSSVQTSFHGPPLFNPPPVQYIHSTTGLVHCTVRRCKVDWQQKQNCRWGFISTKKATVLSFETYDGTEVPVLLAFRTNPWHFQIFRYGSHERPIGGLTRLSASFTSVVYHLYECMTKCYHQSCTVRTTGVITYKVQLPAKCSLPSAISNTRDQRPPRVAEFALPAYHSSESIKQFEIACHESITKSGIISQVTESGKRVIVLKNKVPYSLGNGKWGLNFNGRGKLSSNRNMQLEHDGKIVVQMVKWSDKSFHVDFCEPLTLFQTFGFALAQWHL